MRAGWPRHDLFVVRMMRVMEGEIRRKDGVQRVIPAIDLCSAGSPSSRRADPYLLLSCLRKVDILKSYRK